MAGNEAADLLYPLRHALLRGLTPTERLIYKTHFAASSNNLAVAVMKLIKLIPGDAE